MAARVPPVVPFVFGLAGVGLVLAAVRNTSPIAQLRAVLSGQGSAGQIDPRAGGLTAPGESGASFANDPTLAVVTGHDPAGLVSIGQGGHRLRADAATAFAVWQGQFGSTIYVTDSYRSYAVQKAGHDADPGRFADPAKSEHVKGTAVDVDLGKVGAAPPAGGKPGNAVWQRLYATATAAGWHNPRGPYSGDHREPWHFSRNGG